MLLSELKDDMLLSGEEFIDFFESLNTIISGLRWETHGTSTLTAFRFYDVEIRVQITLAPQFSELPTELKGKRVAEVSFYSIDPTTNNIQHTAINKFNVTQALQILSIVVDAVMSKFENYDAYYFSAEKRYPDYKNKKKIYQRIARKVAKYNNVLERSKETPQATLFLISKVPININEQTDWFNFIIWHSQNAYIPVFPEVKT